MAIANFTDLSVTIADWLNRADLDQKIPDFILLAESSLNKALRHSRMVSTTSLSLSANTQKVAIPADFLEPIYAQAANDPDNAMEQVSAQQLIIMRRNRLRSSGSPKFFAILGRFLEVAPIPTVVTQIDLTYYQAIPALSAGSPTNWLLTYDPDIYLYTALLHAAPFLKDDARAAVYDNLVTKQIVSAVKGHQTATFDNLKVPGFTLDAPADAPKNPVGGSGPLGGS